ncbi:MAG: hypothetical protein EZS28_007895 [Streblomastix strix]|uniref:Uncharacterized protein n=2 Tax=Streblomastix strix TaxID=222440 RepID=A0A5J4WQB3_9EUKA|nr:MAG: hypothetical protein EZS28_007895 [Streblomastix strix]
MLHQNENLALEQYQEIQIRRTYNDMPPPNTGPRDQHPPGQGLYAQRNAAIPQSAIFPHTLDADQQIRGFPNARTKNDNIGRALVREYRTQQTGESQNNNVEHLQWMILEHSGENITQI